MVLASLASKIMMQLRMSEYGGELPENFQQYCFRVLALHVCDGECSDIFVYMNDTYFVVNASFHHD